MKEKIAIIGGGLSGSLLAICLAKRGAQVELYERRGDIRKGQAAAGRSINLALSTRGIEALKRVGLAEQVLNDAIPMNGRMMHSVDGQLTYQAYGKEGQYINSVSRSLLNIKLLELADEFDNVKILFKQKCVDVDLNKNTAVMEDENGVQTSITADILFGSDGSFSAVRNEMQKTSRFTYSQTYENYGYKELEIVPGPDNSFQAEEHALHIWPRGEFMMIALPNPGGNFTCTLFLPYEGERSFDKLQTPQEIEAFFKQYFADAIPMMPNYLEDFMSNPTGSLVTIRCTPWVNKKFALIGDAAHAVIPFYGQGMNCSFEDVKELDEIIEEQYPNWDNIFKKYQEARIKNANAIADLACKNFVEMRDLVGRPEFMRFKKIDNDLCAHYPEIYKSQYELVSFSKTSYKYAQDMGYKNEALIAHIMEHNLDTDIQNSAVIKPLIERFVLN
jgi:kynurenine 3-monooxygenase